MNQEHLSWLQEHLKDIYQTPVLENFLGLHIEEINIGKVVLSMKILDNHRNMYGSLHGGVLSSISDIAMAISCITYGRRVVTCDLNVGYLRNVPFGGTLVASGQVIANGINLMRATCEILYKNQLLVNSHASYFVTGDYTIDDFKKMKLT
jgi:uncharacterized protein (TIGR00369 family)